MPNLRSRLADLAASFADSVIDVIRSSSLHELLNETSHSKGAHRGDILGKASTHTTRSAGGRLPRRSADEISAVLDQIVALVAKHKDGLRAEQIRAELGLQAKELPRVLKEGLTTKRLRCKGQKRATTYFSK
jgi:ribosomal protein L22